MHRTNPNFWRSVITHSLHSLAVETEAPSALSDFAASPAIDVQPATSGQFAVDAARLLADTRCHQVVVLDVRGASPLTDYLVIASGTSPRQMKSAADKVSELGVTVGYETLNRVTESAQWIVMDFVDVVIHIFSQDARQYYDLDNLCEARRINWEQPV